MVRLYLQSTSRPTESIYLQCCRSIAKSGSSGYASTLRLVIFLHCSYYFPGYILIRRSVGRLGNVYFFGSALFFLIAILRLTADHFSYRADTIVCVLQCKVLNGTYHRTGTYQYLVEIVLFSCSTLSQIMCVFSRWQVINTKLMESIFGS